MATVKEAFSKLREWNRTSALLKMTAIADGNPPETFVGKIIGIDEAARLARFSVRDSREGRTVDFNECAFTVGDRAFLAEFGETNIFKCERVMQSVNNVRPISR